MMMDLDKFFKEKEIPYTEWTIEHEGIIHFINSDVVIEAILSTEGMERTKIAGTLSWLDFTNTNIIDYLYFLAKSLVSNMSVK